MWALADSMAGLHLLDLHQPCSLLQLTPQIPLTVAHVLCCVPGSDTNIGTSQLRISVALCVMLTMVASKCLFVLHQEQKASMLDDSSISCCAQELCPPHSTKHCHA